MYLTIDIGIWEIRGSCNEACAMHELNCTLNSVSKQTALSPENSGEVVRAFQEAGASCTRIKPNHWQDIAGSPSVESSSGYCYGFGNGGSNMALPPESTCNGKNAGHQPLCYCEVTRKHCIRVRTTLCTFSFPKPLFFNLSLGPKLDFRCHWPKLF